MTTDAEIATAYRAEVLAKGDRAELAAIDGMPDEFVAALVQGDRARADRVALEMYEEMGGKPKNWERESDDFREEYIEAALVEVRARSCGSEDWP